LRPDGPGSVPTSKEYALEALLVIVAVLLSATLIVLIAGILIYIRRLDKAIAEISHTLSVTRKEILPLSEDIRRVLANADGMITSGRQQCDRMKRVTDAAEQLLDGRAVTRAAGVAVSTSRNTMLIALEGLKQGLKALRQSKSETKEESRNEQ